MSFNGGGANTGGVLQVEQGSLKIQQWTTTFSIGGGESLTNDFTVPANKKWIIKGVNSSSLSFVGTQGLQQTRLNIGGLLMYLQSPPSTFVTYWAVQPLTLKAGDILRITSGTSAWTSGQLLWSFAYMESDA
jgi:hypothetical protein